MPENVPPLMTSLERAHFFWARCLPTERHDVLTALDKIADEIPSANVANTLDAMACILEPRRDPKPNL